MSYRVTHRMGGMSRHQDLAHVDLVLEPLLAELDEEDDPEHPDVSVSSGDWSLGIVRDGSVAWENVEDGEPRHLPSLPRAEVLRLARAVARGDLALLEAQPWLPGYWR